MPKKGRPDSYWEGVMKLYAKGQYRFSTGKTPGSQRWKDVLRKIDACPRHKGQVVDLLRRTIKCNCGYHEDGSELATSQSATSRSTIMPSQVTLTTSRPPAASHTTVRPPAASHTTVRPTEASHSTVRSPAASQTTIQQPAASHTQVRPSAASHTTVGPSAASNTQVRPPPASHTQVRPPPASHTQVRPPPASHTQVRPSAPSHTQVRLSAASHTTVGLSAARNTQVRPSAASNTQVRPSAASNTQVGPSAASNTQVRPSAASNTQVRPSAASNTQVRPSAASNTQVRPSAASNTQFRPSAASNIQVRPSAASNTQVRPSAASNTQVRPSAASNTQVRPSAASNIQVGPSAASNTQVRPSAASHTQVGPPPASHTQARQSAASLTTLQPTAASHTIVRPPEASHTTVKSVDSHSIVGLPSPTQSTSTSSINCGMCNRTVIIEEFDQHLLEMHAMVKCDLCKDSFEGEIALATHIENQHNVTLSTQTQRPLPTVQQEVPTVNMPCFEQQKMSTEEPTLEIYIEEEIPTLDTVSTHQQMPATMDTSLTVQQDTHTWQFPQAHLEWQSFLPNQFKKVIAPGDQTWIAQCLYDHRGRLKDSLPNQNWYYPPNPCPSATSPPNPWAYFRQRMFLWAPMRMWQIPLQCPRCKSQLQHSGIYPKAREVVDVDSRYYLIGLDYPRCGRCKLPICPWNPEILSQLDPSHRNMFPAVLTKNEALDKKCVTLMKPRTQGNSSSYIHQAIHEVHSEEWGKRCIQYLSDCELHRKGAVLTGNITKYMPPPPFRPLPLAQWFEMAHANEILSHAEEMKAVITSTYGRVLKVDSTKKITKKLAGDIGETASWMTNIANEHSQVLNSVLTTGEGPALYEVCQGIVQRYRDAGEPEPQVIYVDRDCCSQTGEPAVLEWFKPWKCHVRLDVFHFMRRFTKGLTTEHHPLYGTFCSKFSSCIFVWDKEDYAKLRDAKRSEFKKKYRGVVPTEKQISSAITSSELARHCRRRTREVDEMKGMISQLLKEMWDLTDTTGLHLINAESMEQVWSVQQKHLPCIIDPPGVHLYTKTGSLEKGGKLLDVLKCARGSSSLEAFHRHQCTFIPGWRANAVHTQMYMVEGGSRWNINRAREVSDLAETSQTRLYDIRMMSSINGLSQRVLEVDLLPEFCPPGKPTGELVAVDYLLAQSGIGDLRSVSQDVINDPDDGEVLPELNLEEAAEEEFLDDTVCLAEDIDSKFQTRESESPEATQPAEFITQCERCGIMLDTGDMAVHVVTHMSDRETGDPVSQEDSDIDRQDASESHKPVHEIRHDAQGIPGWEAVDALAAYLVDLDTSVTALSTADTDTIVQLYNKLHECDKTSTKFSPKSKKERLLGPWRASRKRSGAIPGVQASERLYMTHGQAAQSPTSNRVSECVCLRLMRSYQQARNRPKDVCGKTLPLTQSIVHIYRLIQQLLADSREIQEETNLVLVTINNTTVSAWLNKRQKRMDRDALLQGTMLPESVTTAKQPLLKAQPRPSQLLEHGHELMAFPEPENRQGQSVKRPRNRLSTETSTSETTPEDITPQTGPVAQSASQPMWHPGPWPAPPPFPQGFPGWYGWPPFYMPPYGPPSVRPPSLSPPSTTGHPPLSAMPLPTSLPAQSSRHRDWRHRKAAQEDQERIARGEPPKKRYKKPGQYRYICTKCNKQKCAETGHTQVKGKWYCPSIGMTVEEWKEQLN